MSHSHGPESLRAVCKFRTKRECEDNFADWQAMQMVLLAYNIVMQGRAKRYKKDKGQFAQLVRLIAGEQDDILTDEGNPNMSPWVNRLRAAIQRIKAGELPGYTLYTPEEPAESEVT